MKKLLLTLIVTAFAGLNLQSQIINVPDDYPTIQEGINASSNGDTVLVQPGTYVEQIIYNGKSITVGSLFLTTDDESYIEETIIDGDAYGLPCVRIMNGESTGTRLVGFTIQNGWVGSDNFGGGVHIWGGIKASLEYLIIKDNFCNGMGAGGIMCYTSTIKILNTRFINNTITGYGSAGLNPGYSNVEVVDCVFINNTGMISGIFNRGSSVRFINSVIAGNSTIAIINENKFEIINSIIVNNESGFRSTGGSPKIINSIISGNSIYNIKILGGGPLCIDHSIIEGGEEGIEIVYPNQLQYGENNIDSPPYFLDAQNNDFRLSDYSPGIGAGTWEAIMIEDTLYAPNYDFVNASRPQPSGTMPDIGAYESLLGEPLVIVANFVASETQVTMNEEVQFNELSLGGPVSWEWDFENDGSYDSFEQNPSFSYNEPGLYSVKLKVTDVNGMTDSLVKENYILVEPPLVAYFSFDPQSGSVGLPVHFTDESTGENINSWQWDFQNDGIIDSQESNPQFTYTQEGNYEVNLTISDGAYFDDTIKQIEVSYAYEPVISSILDVPNDEGRQVVINWFKSYWDNGNYLYRIWRLQNWADTPWEFMGEIPSQGFDEYAFIAPTISDSNAQGIPYFTYLVSYNDQGQGTFNSEPDSGYSVDNLAPSAPQNLLGYLDNSNFNLHWDPSTAADFDYFSIYQTDEEGIPVLLQNQVENAAILELSYESKKTMVSAFDYNGNESGFSSQVMVPFYREITIPAGWSGFSYPVIPETPQLELMMAPINSMVIMQNMSGVYWPDMAVNSIGEFSAHEGYTLKMNTEQTLPLIGYNETDKIINLPVGWSVLPVLSDEAVPILEIAGQMGDKLEILKEIAGTGIYWPEMGINQIETLEPGKAYFIKLNEAVTISY